MFYLHHVSFLVHKLYWVKNRTTFCLFLIVCGFVSYEKQRIQNVLTLCNNSKCLQLTSFQKQTFIPLNFYNFRICFEFLS